MATVMVSAQRVTTSCDVERKEIAKKQLALDYSMTIGIIGLVESRKKEYLERTLWRVPPYQNINLIDGICD